MMANLKDQFEVWARSKSISLAHDLDGEYYYPQAKAAWAAWQESPAQSIAQEVTQQAAKFQVGCEREDGLLNIHAENETCEVCAPTITPTTQREADERAQKAETAEQVRVLADCDCGCNDPVATDPIEMLEFLARRFEHAGVSKAVADVYAHDIRKILQAIAPTTSTVSAPEEVQEQLVKALRGFVAYAEACDDDSHEIDRAREALAAFDALRTTSGKGEAA